jgi:hypothetical protein
VTTYGGIAAVIVPQPDSTETEVARQAALAERERLLRLRAAAAILDAARRGCWPLAEPGTAEALVLLIISADRWHDQSLVLAS